MKSESEIRTRLEGIGQPSSYNDEIESEVLEWVLNDHINDYEPPEPDVAYPDQLSDAEHASPHTSTVPSRSQLSAVLAFHGPDSETVDYYEHAFLNDTMGRLWVGGSEFEGAIITDCAVTEAGDDPPALTVELIAIPDDISTKTAEYIRRANIFPPDQDVRLTFDFDQTDD